MAYSHRTAHNSFLAGYIAGTTSQAPYVDPHAAARAANLPAWIQTAHPGALNDLDLTTLHPQYLADLYPAIWTYGPRGETHLTQLEKISAHLDDVIYNNHGTGFLDAINTDLHSMDQVYDNFDIIPDLTDHATATGLPRPGDAIFGTANHSTFTPTDDLLNHHIWTTYADDQNDFHNFLYRFALLSIHGDYFTSLNLWETNTAMKAYHAFCNTWDIPT